MFSQQVHGDLAWDFHKMTSTNLGQAFHALLQDQPVFVPGAALDSVMKPAVSTERKGMLVGISEGWVGEEEESLTAEQPLYTRAGARKGWADRDPWTWPLPTPLTAGSPRTAGVEKSQKTASAGSKKNTGAGGIDVDTHMVACRRKIFADVLHPWEQWLENLSISGVFKGHLGCVQNEILAAILDTQFTHLCVIHLFKEKDKHRVGKPRSFYPSTCLFLWK